MRVGHVAVAVFWSLGALAGHPDDGKCPSAAARLAPSPPPWALNLPLESQVLEARIRHEHRLHNRAVVSGRRIGLGLSHHLKELRGQKAITYEFWRRSGITSWDVYDRDEFPMAFEQATASAEIIYFNLTGINMTAAMVASRRPLRSDWNATAWELRHVLSRPELKSKTIFLLDGKKMDWVEMVNTVTFPDALVEDRGMRYHVRSRTGRDELMRLAFGDKWTEAR